MNHILFPITYTCNLDCPFCDLQGKSEEDTEKCMDNILKMAGSIEWVYITGGEPFMVPNLIEICDRLKAAGFKVGVTTNGTHFLPEVAEHVDRIGISLDGDKDFHDAGRGEGVFDKAIKLLKAVKGKCETVAMSVALKDNGEALERLKPILERIDPTYWQIQRDVHDDTVLIAV